MYEILPMTNKTKLLSLGDPSGQRTSRYWNEWFDAVCTSNHKTSFEWYTSCDEVARVLHSHIDSTDENNNNNDNNKVRQNNNVENDDDEIIAKDDLIVESSSSVLDSKKQRRRFVHPGSGNCKSISSSSYFIYLKRLREYYRLSYFISRV